MKIVNLDAFDNEDIELTLGGKKYIMPGEFSVEHFLQMWNIRQKLDENPEDPVLWERQYEFLYELFSLKNDMGDFNEFKKIFTSKKIGLFYRVIVETFQDANESAGRIEKKTILEQKEEPEDEQTRP